MKTTNTEKLELLEKAWNARQISESDYLMWKRVYVKISATTTTKHKRYKRQEKK